MNLRVRVNKLESAAPAVPAHYSGAEITALMERVVGVEPRTLMTDAMTMQFLGDPRSRGPVRQIIREINQGRSALPVVRSCGHPVAASTTF